MYTSRQAWKTVNASLASTAVVVLSVLPVNKFAPAFLNYPAAGYTADVVEASAAGTFVNLSAPIVVNDDDYVRALNTYSYSTVHLSPSWPIHELMMRRRDLRNDDAVAKECSGERERRRGRDGWSGECLQVSLVGPEAARDGMRWDSVACGAPAGSGVKRGDGKR